MKNRLSRLSWVFASLFGLSLSGASACTADPTGADPAPNPSGKEPGAKCAEAVECKSLSCSGGTCAAVAGGNVLDHMKDGTETDVDCGGSSVTKCADDKACKVAADCASGVC